MLDLLAFYAWTLPAAMAMAAVLSLWGGHLAARSRTLQTFSVSQGAIIGGFLGLLCLGEIGHQDPQAHLWPMLGSLICAAATLGLTDLWAQNAKTSTGAFFATVFSVLLCANHLVSAVFPVLESHMSSWFFGDLVTLSEFDGKWILVFATLALAYVLWFARTIMEGTFDRALFGNEHRAKGVWHQRTFLFASILVICVSVHFFGFLFTVLMLFLPTTILAAHGKGGWKAHFISTAIVASGSTLMGTLATLQWSWLPTTPTIGMTAGLAGLTWLLMLKMLRR